MGFVEAVKSAFSNYANFSGRSPRAAWWYWILFVIVAVIVLEILDMAIFGADSYFPLTMIFSVATFVPYLAVGVRRLHDIDKSGWFQLVCFIPLIGFFLLLYWWAKQGDPYENRFGVPVSPLGEP